MNAFDFKTLMQFAMEYLERDVDRMTIQTKKLGKQISKSVFIINLENLSAVHITYKKGFGTAYEFIKIYQDCFPERIKAIYCINASFYFNVGFTILKSIMANELLKKIHVFGKTGWQELLLNIIDPGELPAFLGGNKTDPDGNPLCETWISHGKKVPEELYMKNSKKLLCQEDGVEKLSVYRYSSSEVTYNIYEPNTFLEWEFVTSKDIFFGLYYKDVSQQNPQVEELIPKRKVESVDSAVTGVYKCNKLGAYIIVFDNTHSWLHSKEVYYRVRITKPE